MAGDLRGALVTWSVSISELESVSVAMIRRDNSLAAIKTFSAYADEARDVGAINA